MNLTDVTLSLYKYRIKSFVLSYGKKGKIKKHTVESSLVSKMDIIENYDSEIFPFFTITVSLPSNVYRDMASTTNKPTINAVLNIQKGKFNEALSEDTDQSISYRDVIKDSFHAIIAVSDSQFTAKEQKKVEKSDSYGQLSTVTFSLYKKSFYDNYQTIVNANMKVGTLMDALVYVFNKANLKEILVSPPDNTKTYKEYIIPPLQAHAIISRICDTYAFHKKGSIIFFGLDRGYVIDKVPKCTAFQKNEYKITYVSVFTSSKGTMQTGGSYENKTKKYNVINAVEVSPNNTSDATKKSAGSNMISVDKDGTITKTNKKATKITNVVVQNEGSSTPQDINRAIKESEKGISCQLINEDISAIKPNRQFIVSAEGSEYKKYNGKYRLIRAVHSFSKEGNYFSLNSVIELGGS